MVKAPEAGPGCRGVKAAATVTAVTGGGNGNPGGMEPVAGLEEGGEEGGEGEVERVVADEGVDRVAPRLHPLAHLPSRPPSITSPVCHVPVCHVPAYPHIPRLSRPPSVTSPPIHTSPASTPRRICVTRIGCLVT